MGSEGEFFLTGVVALDVTAGVSVLVCDSEVDSVRRMNWIALHPIILDWIT